VIEVQATRPSRRWLPWAAAGIAVVLVIGAGTWWFSWSARLVWPGDGSFGIGEPAEGGQATWTFGGLSVCLQGVDSAVVESVEVESGGLRVTDFAVRATPQPGRDGVTMLFGAEPAPLNATDFGGDRNVHGRCADEGYTELAVELTRPTGGTAYADGLLVDWSAGVRSGTLRIPGRFALCDAASSATPTCDAISQSETDVS
jgi:hypothetical protein